MRHRAAFGLRAHSGWAILLTVAGPVSGPTLIDRRRVALADSAPAQPYHDAAKLNDVGSAAALIHRAHGDARQRAHTAIAAALADATHRGYEVRRAAILANRARPLPTLDIILRSHPLLHTAEGELFRQVLAEACGHVGIAVEACSERDVYDEGSRILRISPAALRKRLSSIGQSVGPPWTAEHKAAFVAGWRQLAG